MYVCVHYLEPVNGTVDERWELCYQIDVYYLEPVNGTVDERWELCYMIDVYYLEPVNGIVDERWELCYMINVYYLEPVNGAAVDKWWKLSESVPEGISNGTKGDDDVQVFFATIYKEGEQCQRAEIGVLVAGSSLGSWTHLLQTYNHKTAFKLRTSFWW